MLMINVMLQPKPQPKQTWGQWLADWWDNVVLHICCAPVVLIWLIDSRIIDRDWPKILRGERLDTD